MRHDPCGSFIEGVSVHARNNFKVLFHTESFLLLLFYLKAQKQTKTYFRKITQSKAHTSHMTA